MSLVQEGLETPIDNFVFRQCPAEFKLKVTNSHDEIPSWTESVASLPHKSSLIQISHRRGIIFFPYHENGALGFAPIINLAEKENLSAEFLSFIGDDSFISAICLDPSEDFIYVAKGSKMIYAVNLTAADKRPFYDVKEKLEDVAIECVASDKHGIFVLLQNGNILNFNSINLIPIELFISKIVNGPISCISQVKNNLMAVGSKEKPEIYLINLENGEVTFKTIYVPFEDLSCGPIGISSIFLFEDENNLLFSCSPQNPETDDVPLLLLENFSNETEMKFSYFFDPCASRPPRQNQFYFQTLPISKWADNLVDLVVVGNFASPDLGICGRFDVSGEFQTFFIDNDEGLAQLPFSSGEVTFPLGLALDLSSKTFLDNLKDPEGQKYPPAPIIWVLTNKAHLCSFSMVKIDETKSFSFMRQVPDIKFPPASKSFEEISSEELESFSSSEADETDYESEEVQPQTPPQKTHVDSAAVTASTPQTPSKVPLQQLASLQKSAEIKPVVENLSLSSFKPAPVISDPTKSISNHATSGPFKPANQPSIKPLQSIAAPVKTVSVLIKQEEMMETINVSSYQNILLAEVATTHAAMQEDLFSLKQISLKNSLLLRQNSQKYFNSLESLENYTVSLEKLVASSDIVFLGIKDRLDELKFDLKELMGKMKQVKSSWNRIKQDNSIDWDSRGKALSLCSQDLFERIDRLRNFASNPIEASKYRATLKSLVDSTQEKVQLLMAHLSNLFVSQNEEISAVFSDFDGLSLSSSLSRECLLDQLGVLSLGTSREQLRNSREQSERRNKSLLNAVKARGSRLLIPKRYTPSFNSATDEKYLKLTPEDESLINSFISAITLTEEVPEFAETAILAKLSLEDKEANVAAARPSVAPAVETKSFGFKPVAEPRPFELKPVAESKTFEFKPATEIMPSKPSESKIIGTSSSPKFKLPGTKPTESSPFEFKSSTSPSNSSGIFSFSSATNDKPQSSIAAAAFNIKPLESKSTTFISPSISTASVKSDCSNISVKSEASSVSAKSEASSTSTGTPKIPSIFTMASQPAAIEHESVLKKESPLPTFDSLGFGADVKEGQDEAVKPIPSIFGVKAAGKEDRYENETLRSETSKSESTTYFSFSSPSISTTSDKKDKPVAATAPVQGFSFSFKPEISNEPVKDKMVEEVKGSAKGAVKEQLKDSTPESFPAVTTTPAPAFSFSFAPSAEKSPLQPASSGFSITSKPTFGIPSAPVFGSTSFPSAASFGSVPPAFGQTSFPAAVINAPMPAPAASAGSSGFAAFAAASNQGAAGFSAFAAPQGNNGNGLTFASFLSSDKNKKQEPEQGSSVAPSSFSFTGFRE